MSGELRAFYIFGEFNLDLEKILVL